MGCKIKLATMGKIKGYDHDRATPFELNKGGCKNSGAELQKCKTVKSGKCSIAGFNLKGHCGMKIKKYHPYPDDGRRPGLRPRRGGAPAQPTPRRTARAPVNAATRAAAIVPPVAAANNVAAAVPLNPEAAAARRAEKRPATDTLEQGRSITGANKRARTSTPTPTPPASPPKGRPTRAAKNTANDRLQQMNKHKERLAKARKK